MAFSEGNQLFAGHFHALLDEMNAGMLNSQRNGTGNRLSNIKDTFAETFQLQLSLLHQIMVSRDDLSSLSYDWAKSKEKAPDVSDAKQNVETTYSSKFQFIEHKDLFIKMVQKIQPKMNYVSDYVANTAILELRIFKRRYHFRL